MHPQPTRATSTCILNRHVQHQHASSTDTCNINMHPQPTRATSTCILNRHVRTLTCMHSKHVQYAPSTRATTQASIIQQAHKIILMAPFLQERTAVHIFINRNNSNIVDPFSKRKFKKKLIELIRMPVHKCNSGGDQVTCKFNLNNFIENQIQFLIMIVQNDQTDRRPLSVCLTDFCSGSIPCMNNIYPFNYVFEPLYTTFVHSTFVHSTFEARRWECSKVECTKFEHSISCIPPSRLEGGMLEGGMLEVRAFHIVHSTFEARRWNARRWNARSSSIPSSCIPPSSIPPSSIPPSGIPPSSIPPSRHSTFGHSTFKHSTFEHTTFVHVYSMLRACMPYTLRKPPFQHSTVKICTT